MEQGLSPPEANRSVPFRSSLTLAVQVITKDFLIPATFNLLESSCYFSVKLDRLMEPNRKLTGFSKFAWFTLAYNVVVIIWGVFLRASHSGDGCGQHWLTCNGEVVPSAPQLKTVIEYSHRVSTAVAGLVVLALVIWAFRRFGKGSDVTKAAFLSLVFIIIEALIGRGLVLTGNTAGNWTPSRPYWTIGHLINTFLLLAALTATAWYSSPNRH